VQSLTSNTEEES